jgi:hypothetical protein
MIDLKLDRASWLSRRRDDIELEGLDSCLVPSVLPDPLLKRGMT